MINNIILGESYVDVFGRDGFLELFDRENQFIEKFLIPAHVINSFAK